MKTLGLGSHRNIDIDQLKFGEELLKYAASKERGPSSRLCYTDGMCDIDIYQQENGTWVIYWSPSDATYVYHFFDEEEFKKVILWLKIEYKNKNNGSLQDNKAVRSEHRQGD